MKHHVLCIDSEQTITTHASRLLKEKIKIRRKTKRNFLWRHRNKWQQAVCKCCALPHPTPGTVVRYIINHIECHRHVVVSLAGGRWPQSPRARNTTRPDGRMAIHVTLALWRLIRSHASGGNCKALKITNILRMKTSTSQKTILSDSSDLQTKKRITLAWQTKIS